MLVFLCTIENVPLSLKSLQLLKWNDENGRPHAFHLVDRVSVEWKKYGIFLGFELNQLDVWKQESLGNLTTCWLRVMEEWLTKGSTQDYPATWEGLYTLLKDCDHSEVANELEKSVTACAQNTCS